MLSHVKAGAFVDTSITTAEENAFHVAINDTSAFTTFKPAGNNAFAFEHPLMLFPGSVRPSYLYSGWKQVPWTSKPILQQPGLRNRFKDEAIMLQLLRVKGWKQGIKSKLLKKKINKPTARLK